MNATANTRTSWRRRVVASTAARIRAAQIKTYTTLYRGQSIPLSDGPPGPVRGARPQEPVRPAPPPGPARRKHPGPLRGGGGRVPHPGGPRTDLRGRRRCARRVLGAPAGVRGCVLQPRTGGVEQPRGNRDRRAGPRDETPGGGRELRNPGEAFRNPSVHEPGSREAVRAANPGRDPEGDRESRRPAGRTPCRGAGEPRVPVHGGRRRPRRAPDGEPGARARPRGLRCGDDRRVARDETRMQGHRRGVQWLEGPRTAAAVGRPPQGPLLGGRHGPPGARAGVPLGGSVPRLAARRSWTEEARPRGPRVPSRRRPGRRPPPGTRDPDRVRVSLLALPVVRADARAGPFRALPFVHQT